MPPRRPTASKGPRAAGAPSGPPPATSATKSEVELDITEDLSKLNIGSLTSDIPVIPLKKPSKRPKPPPFRFMDLPYELRLEIYSYHFANFGEVIDLDHDNQKRIHRKLAILKVSRAVYREASYVFFASHPARIFPCSPGRYFKTTKPLLARLKPRQRVNFTSLELRLGPGWSQPPKGWVVNEKLGLADCVNVRKISVFVECDPSNDTFKGFRQANGFFEGFSTNLLTGVLDDMPWVKHLEFDAWSSVKKSGSLMTALLEVATSRNLRITWGRDRGWTDEDEEEEPPQPINLNAPLRADRWANTDIPVLV